MIRIVLTDDQNATRQKLRLSLDREADIEVVAEADDMVSVVRRVHGFLPHVLVLDLGMPGDSSIEMLRRLHKQVPETKVVVLAMSEDPVFARRALDAGAIGFVFKGTVTVDLQQAVRHAARGEQYVSPSVYQRLALLRDSPTEARLTPRELEVLRRIALGYTSVEVADQLDLSPRTIETHRARILRKLAIVTRAQLVSYALAHGLLGNGLVGNV